MSYWDLLFEGKKLKEALSLLKDEKELDLNKFIKKRSLFQLACMKGDLEIVKFLISKGADINIYSEDKITPLHLACREGNLEIVKFLLSQKDVKIDQQDLDGYSALHYAATGKHQKIIKELVLKGINVNLKDSFNRTALHKSVEQNDELSCHYLIDSGIDLNVQNTSGWTALHIASYNSFGTICHILVHHHADTNLMNNLNQKAIHWGYGLFDKKEHHHTTAEGTDHI